MRKRLGTLITTVAWDPEPFGTVEITDAMEIGDVKLHAGHVYLKNLTEILRRSRAGKTDGTIHALKKTHNRYS